MREGDTVFTLQLDTPIDADDFNAVTFDELMSLVEVEIDEGAPTSALALALSDIMFLRATAYSLPSAVDGSLAMRQVTNTSAVAVFTEFASVCFSPSAACVDA